MILGIIIKAVNAIHFSSLIDFTFEFIPQLLFMLCTFGYMEFTIIFKWLKDYGSIEEKASRAPSIISLMINMPLKEGLPDD